MFEKLLAVLPYNPSLAHQLSFYSRRMREEASIRRTGMVFLVLAFMIQFIAVINPPQSTSASSSNDLISGGISSAADAAHKCDSNENNYRNVLGVYGIKCSDIHGASTVTLNGCGDNYYSFGYTPQGFAGEEPVNVPNGRNVYSRKLADWGCASPYQALKFHGGGKTYFILYNCGNLVSVGPPQPVVVTTTTKFVNKCQFDHSLPSTSPKCFRHCDVPGLGSLPQNSPKCNKPCKYDSHLPANSPKCFKPCKYDHNLPADSPKCFKPCQYNPNLPSDSPKCVPCKEGNKLACVVVHKKASNITGHIADANNTTANPGDVITYTLSATNSGKADIKSFVFQENLSDVLDYADVTDLHGGKIDSNHIVTWKAQTLKSKKTASHQITVKVKDPVPQTPAGLSDPDHYNLIMTNVYGDTINIHVPGSPNKTIETATAAGTLPNTGPGTSLMVAAAIVVVGGYFYGRARLLAKESNLAVQESAAA